MKKLRTYLNRICHIQWLKYVVVVILGVVLVGFVDENSMWRHFRNSQYISELQTEIDRYTELYERDQARIHELDSDPTAIRKIARERYFMKADDEDIFVLEE